MRYLALFCLCLIWTLQAAAVQKDPEKKICLNMIVRNEKEVIRRCLASAKPLIDYWVIVDTGSTDGTQEIIKEFMKDIPGELHERPWVNFAVNRNQALELCQGKGDYLLLIDADEEFSIVDPNALAKLDQDSYLFKIHEVRDNSIDYTRMLLINNHLPWKWTGVLHEIVECATPYSSNPMYGITVISRSEEGARSKDPKKYYKDAAILEEALKTDPNNSRYVFYLAQSYLNVQEYAKSLKYYQKRANMGGFDEEVYMSLYVSGHLQEKLQLPSHVFTDSYWKAFHYRPIRAEPLYRLADYYKRTGYPLMAYLLASYALNIPYPKDVLFIEPWIYEWGLLVCAGESAALLDKKEEAIAFLEKALVSARLPSDVRCTEEQNLHTLKRQ